MVHNTTSYAVKRLLRWFQAINWQWHAVVAVTCHFVSWMFARIVPFIFTSLIVILQRCLVIVGWSYVCQPKGKPKTHRCFNLSCWNLVREMFEHWIWRSSNLLGVVCLLPETWGGSILYLFEKFHEHLGQRHDIFGAQFAEFFKVRHRRALARLYIVDRVMMLE